MILFKYRPWNQFTADLLALGKIYFPTRKRLNDPAELVHPVQFEVSTWADAFDRARSKIKNETFDLSISIGNTLDRLEALRLVPGTNVASSEWGSYFSLPDRFLRMVEAVFDRVEVHDAIRFYALTLAEDRIQLYDSEEALVQRLNAKLDNFGVLSLSARCNCPAMWAHYAQNHEGVIVMLDTSNDRLIGAAKPVEYMDTRPTTTVDTVVENLYRKGKVWQYEEEYRVLLKNGDTVQSSGAVVGVILGMRMREADRQQAIDLAGRRQGAVAIYQAVADSRNFSILHEPIG